MDSIGRTWLAFWKIRLHSFLEKLTQSELATLLVQLPVTFKVSPTSLSQSFVVFSAAWLQMSLFQFSQ
jgi:uncharacterized membrane protein (DUF4010 family)